MTIDPDPYGLVFSSLRINFPVGKTIGLAIIILALVVGVSESAARTDFARGHLPVPSLKSSNPYFESAVAQADLIYEEQGRIECIVLGSSMVLTDYDPVEFGVAYRDRVGRDLSCINFGIPGLVSETAGDLARALANKYHPRLLIFGTAARDYSEKVKQRNYLGTTTLLDNPWVLYQQGYYSVEGWMMNFSYSYRYFLAIKNEINREPVTNTLEPEQPHVIDLEQLPVYSEEAGTFDLLSDYEVSPQGLAGLMKILELKQRGIEVFIVEMPVHSTYIEFFGRGLTDQQSFIRQVSEQADRSGAPFWTQSDQLDLPNENWANRNHLNMNGAKVFSYWLGQKLADSITQNIIVDPIQ